MTTQSADLLIKRFILCPSCKDTETAHEISHLEVPFTAKVPWHCPTCGTLFTFAIGADGSVGVEITGQGEPRPRTLDLLKLELKEGPLYFVVDQNPTYHTDDDGRRFWYEENTCAINWLSEVTELVFDGMTDPHGLVEFVRSVEIPKDHVLDAKNYTDLVPFFPEILRT